MSDEVKTFEELIVTGRGLLRINRSKNMRDIKKVQTRFQQWDEDVATWFDDKFPLSGLSADWSVLEAPSFDSKMIFFGTYTEGWDDFFRIVRIRIRFLSSVVKNNSSSKSTTKQSPVKTKESSIKKVFVVHGHNEKVKLEAAGLLGKLNLEPIILHEKPNKGRTIIEKFEDHSDVAFAVVLLTADDKGGKAGTPEVEYLPRARQNVIMELGFFLGKLGRKSVCALYEDGVELPSDYDGVLFVPLDEKGAWKTQLAKEIKASGLPVDLNKL